MNLIEKKCPNCGASLEFNETDKSCKCEYCHRSFEIERTGDNLENYELVLRKVSDVLPMKTFLIPFAIMVAIAAFIILVAAFGGTYAFRVDEPLNDLNVITNRNYKFIDNASEEAILKITFGDQEYQLIGSKERVKEYLLEGKKDSIYIPVYKVTYANWPSLENKYTIYIPVKYENVIQNREGLDVLELGDGIIDAEEYYFNMEHSSYSKGYPTINDLYKKYIYPYKDDDYKISHK